MITTHQEMNAMHLIFHYQKRSGLVYSQMVLNDVAEREYRKATFAIVQEFCEHYLGYSNNRTSTTSKTQNRS